MDGHGTCLRLHLDVFNLGHQDHELLIQVTQSDLIDVFKLVLRVSSSPFLVVFPSLLQEYILPLQEVKGLLSLSLQKFEESPIILVHCFINPAFISSSPFSIR